MHIDQLIDKYKRNELTLDELLLLRQELSQLSSADLDAYMLNDMLNDLTTAKVASNKQSALRVASLRQRLADELFVAPHTKPRWSLERLMKIAAMITIPLLLATTFYLYRETTMVNNAAMIVQTAPGERVSVTLPDGTRVSLNSDSRLVYRPADFNKRSRLIDFEGEAYFEVEKNEQIPFEILTDNLRLRVLGTKFNYLSYPQLTYIEVKLTEGHVLLTSLMKNGIEANLHTNETGRFDKHTGDINVTKHEGKQLIPWIDRQMIFESAPLTDVISTVERTYNVRIHADSLKTNAEPFTGLLPTNDFEEVIKTLQICFGFHYTRSDNELFLSVK